MKPVSDAHLRGAFIAESLRPDACLSDLRIAVDTIRRVPVEDPAPGQPAIWSLVSFVVEEQEAEALADKFAAGLCRGPWYVDFHGPNTTFVVFADAVFRYTRGDTDARARAVAYGLEIGVPEQQLDWRE